MDAPGYDELAQLLREMAGRFGDTAFTDRRRLVSLLSDRLPDARRDIRVVGAAVDERVFDSLARARPEQLAMEIERLAARLENGLGIRSDIAIPVVQACAYGLSLGPLPSAIGTGGAPLPPPAAPAGGSDGWVGLSEPVRPAAPPPPAQQQALPASLPATAPAGKPWQKWAVRGAGAVVLVLGGLAYIGSHVTPEEPARPQQQPEQPQPQQPLPVRRPEPTPQPEPQPPPQPAPQPAPQPVPVPVPAPPPVQSTRYFGNEDYDFGIAPQANLQSNVGSPTPMTIPGATTVTTMQVMNEIRSNHRMVLIDALQNQHASTVTGAVYLPYAGSYGNFSDQAQTNLVNNLNRLVQGHREVPLVFFCLGVNCWESYNAALRARAGGFPNVYWFRGGLQAWEQAGFPMQKLQ